MINKLKKLGFYLLSLAFLISSSLLGVFYYYGRDLPSELTLLNYDPPATTRIFSSENELIEEYAIEHRLIVGFKDIPLIIKGAFIIAEDREFYNHSGLSFQSLLRAIIENTARKSWTKRPAGGSTITQQVAKNLLVGNAKNFSRKIREAIMAFRIESSIPKDKILEIYLNQLYLGKGCYGIGEACNFYFNKTMSKIEPHEAAFLAAIPSAPSVYVNAYNSPKLLMKRNSILYQMYDMGYIDKDQLKYALTQPIKINSKKNKLFSPYFSNEVFRLFLQSISKDSFFRNGYSIKSTMNKKFQYCAQKALEDGIIEYTNQNTFWRGTLGNIFENKAISLKEINNQLPNIINKVQACIVKKINSDDLICELENKKLIRVNCLKYSSKEISLGDIVLCRQKGKSFELYQTPKVSGGIAIMDLSSGNILALSGGYSFDLSSFNCITQAKRQPGSTIKPFVYAAAIESGKDEYDVIEDKPLTIILSNGERYTPHNYSGKSYGKTYLRDGLIYSRNLTTINLAREIGMKQISTLLKSANLANGKIPISAVLGAIEVTPIQLLSAFSAFFNNGKMISPRFITDITKSTHLSSFEPIKENLCSSKQIKIMEPETAETIKNLLHDVVKYGTANSISNLEEKFNLELFGKTGTTNDFKDAWFVGTIKDKLNTYLICIFIGYPKPKSLGEHCSGAKVALPVFANFINYFYSNLEN